MLLCLNYNKTFNTDIKKLISVCLCFFNITERFVEFKNESIYELNILKRKKIQFR